MHQDELGFVFDENLVDRPRPKTKARREAKPVSVQERDESAAIERRDRFNLSAETKLRETHGRCDNSKAETTRSRC